MKPIPKNWLIHSAELNSAETDNWQTESLTTISSLNNVRIEPSSKLITNKQGEQITLSATMFYDCHNSKGLTVNFSHGQKLIFNGNIYTIETIESLYDLKKLHHYELGLIQ